MIVAFDNTILTLVINPDAKPTPNPKTGEPVDHCEQRIKALIDQYSVAGSRILLPTPSLAETFCSIKNFKEVAQKINSYLCFEPAPFDNKAAYELAEITNSALSSGDKFSGVSEQWQKVKFDRQIVAIAKTHGAQILYTDDEGQSKFAKLAGLKVVHSWELDLPAEYAQRDMLNEDD